MISTFESQGTHALFQEEVQYARLGLVIIDEQHRFGVHQRLALREKAAPRCSGRPRALPASRVSWSSETR